ncbi:uncharacterized protein yc1106_01898 [Curvularia clavata]|uniref:Polyketide synthase n=1 Tax=Curvularia clavata TaxID=95742 RepID=A0A9Q8Z283_CURCL|nr:uncharacterized protein yc1106_01898 [Curvularia clavata]
MDHPPEPIAICGMALRLPGGLKTPDQFWELLTQKKDARGRIPLQRFDAEAFHSASGKSGYINSQYGYFLDDSAEVGAVDTSFFRMSQKESGRTDPQQKLLLELVRECFESAGEINWRGKDIGTYVGSFGNDWMEMSLKDHLSKSMYKITGHGDFMHANRLAYEYDLKGPSMTVRTACSASLLSLHEACVAVRNGDCSAALVGGCNLLWSPDAMSDMSEQGVLSLESSCRTFDARADGYARGEAVNMIYIKPLAAAIRDGNPIRAIIRGTAANADGKTQGMSLPSSSSQEQMMRKAYRSAGIAETDISRTAFVECHGTGTPTGDPIETKAVGNVFGNGGVYIGSVKPNVGHSEGASGITSVIKAVLALENRLIPPNIKFETPNPSIPFVEKNLKVPTECTNWPADKLERVSVNSFGIGGANAHVILESATSYKSSQIGQSSDQQDEFSMKQNLTEPEDSGKLFIVTANTADSLQVRLQDLRNYGNDFKKMDDICYTLACRREHLAHRAFAVVKDISMDFRPGVHFTGASSPHLTMIFTGQGAQWPRMGIELLQSNATFASSIRAMDRELKTLQPPPPWSIEEELAKDADYSRLSEAALSQPLCTAIQVALVDALADLAITPHSVLGHSSGEIAAAYVAGMISRRAAIVIAYYRGVVSQEIVRGGGMASIGLSWDEATKYLTEGVVIACNNSPSNVTISGDTTSVSEVVNAIQTQQPETFVRMLRVDVAYHSHHMLPAGAAYKSKIASFREDEDPRKRASSPPYFFSSVTGGLLPASEHVDAHYFRRNLESPVLFLEAFDSLVSKCKDSTQRDLCFLEIGPHSALSGPIRQALTEKSLKFPYVSCLHREQDADKTYLAAIGTLWQHGVNFDADRLTNPSKTRKVLTDVPLYPWDHDGSHLFQNRIAQAWRYPRFPHHELLGSLILENSEDQPSFRNILQLEQIPWLRDHNIHGDVVFPCAAYVAMAGEASRRLYSSDDTNDFTGFSVKNMVIGTAMILEESRVTEVVTSLKKWRINDTLESDGWEFTISSYSGTSWVKHCTGSVEAVSSPSVPPKSSHETLPRKSHATKWYQAMWHVGARYGPFFQGLKNIASSADEPVAKAVASDNTPKDCESRYLIHPTTIDIFFQATSIAACHGKGHALERLCVPTFIKQLDIYDCSGDLQIRTSAKALAYGRIHACGYGVDKRGSLAMNLDTLKLTPLDTTTENDPHAGGITTWDLDPSFASMSALVQHSQEVMNTSKIMKELTALHIQAALERIKDVEPTSETMRKFVAWMRRQPIPDTLRSMEIVSAEAENCSSTALASVMERITENVMELAVDEVSPLELLMADDCLSRIYQEAKFTDRTPYFKLLGHKKPNMRILEIGAGTGGTTQEFLSSLINPSDQGKLWSTYTFTDISAGFFSAAKEKFKDHPTLEFKVLDITKNPVIQGFQPHSYDLVIATNVIHAVPNLQQALRNVHTLLEPNGTFYLEELCGDMKAINFVMGVLPGWWLGEQDGRADEPYVHPERWDSELRAASFSGLTDCMMDASEPYQTHAYMIASPVTDELLPKPVTLLFDDSSQQIAKDLQTELSQSGRFEAVLHDWESETVLPKGDIICLLDVIKPFFMDPDARRWENFRRLIFQISESTYGALWLTRSSQHSCEHPRWGQTPGAIRGIRNDVGISLAMCEIDRINSSSWKAVARIAQKFCGRGHTPSRDMELEYAIEHGSVLVPRIYPFSVNQELHKPANILSAAEDIELDLTIGTVGRLDTLHWAPRTSQKPGKSQVAVEIMATGLNFRDVLTAMDLLEVPRQVLGLEAAGVVRDVGSEVEDLAVGDRVIIMGGASLFTTKALVPSVNCWKFPSSLSFQEAATMPCVFLTVIYGLLEVGQMKSEQTILIHSACGGVGLAAIQICRMLGATTYCTVSSEEKVKFLEEEIGIPRRCIFNSRNRSFVTDVKRVTNEVGVDFVLNSLSGDLLHASWECVAPFGKMIEIGKRDLIANGRMSLHPFAENRSFHGIELANLFTHRPKECRRLLVKMVDLYEAGHIKPIFPIQNFQMAEAEQCFRYMQQGRHIGKVILSKEPLVNRSATSLGLKTAHPRKTPTLNSHASYLLAGGLGGLGRIVANWLVENGARNLIFLSRSAGAKESDQDFFKDLESQGCTVTAIKGSVSSEKDVEKAMTAATAPVRGIMNFSMELQDMNFSQMTHSAWNAVNEPKVHGTWNLHNSCLSREIDLDFFLLFSSLAGVFGGPGQSNYGAANTFLEAFVQYRHSLGLRASAINLCMMYDHGYVADNLLLQERLRLQGTYGIRIPQLLDTITLALSTVEPKLTEGTLRTCSSIMSLGVRSQTPLSDPSNRIVWKNDRRMTYYFDLDSSSDATSAAATGSDSPTKAVKDFINQVLTEPSILTHPDTATFLARQIAKKIAIMLLRPIDDKEDEEIDVNCSLQDVGLDSLIAIEIRSWWKATFGFEITVLQMLRAENMLALGERATEGLEAKYGKIQGDPVAPLVAP